MLFDFRDSQLLTVFFIAACARSFSLPHARALFHCRMRGRPSPLGGRGHGRSIKHDHTLKAAQFRFDLRAPQTFDFFLKVMGVHYRR